jgi:thioredoxin-like negative regulator of GroEL
MNEWTDKELASFLNNKTSGLVYFYTPLCGTCQVASKMLLIIKEMLKIENGKMNLNFYPDVAKDLEIESVPCLKLVREGHVVETIYAFHSIPYLLEKIHEHVM